MSTKPVAPAEGAANPSPQHRQSRLSIDWYGLAHRLFVPAPARVTWRGVTATIAAVTLGAGVSLLRQPGVGALDTVWDEDARIFLADAAARSTVDALLTAYQGYYHVAPRLLAEIAVLFPAELPNALCNLHWPLLYATLWALLWVPTSRTGRLVALGVVALTVTSDLLALAYLPLAAIRVAARRDRHSTLLASVLVAGLAAQFGGLVLHDNPRDLAPPRLDPVWALVSFVLRPVPQVLVGERLLPGEVKSLAGLALVAAAWIVVLAVATAAWRRWTEPRPVLAVVLFVQAVVLYCEAVMAGGLAVPRYAVAPALMVLAALAALVPPRPDAPLQQTKAPMWALVGLVAVVCAANLRLDNPRALGPSWRTGIQQARIACADLDNRDIVAVPIAPLVNGVTAALPCRYIRK